MSDSSRRILFDFLKEENDVNVEDALSAQKSYYESLILDEDMYLINAAPLHSGRRSRLWGTMKRRGYESIPHGIGIYLRLEEDGVVIRLVLQCRDDSSRGRRPSVNDLVRQSRLLDVPLEELDGFNYELDSKRTVSDEISKDEIERGEHYKLELVYRLSERDVGDVASMDEIYLNRLKKAMGQLVACYDTIVEDEVFHSRSQNIPMKKLIGGEIVEHTKNMILQGPPGTGKTYHTVLYAVAIIEGKSFHVVKDEVQRDGYEVVKKRYTKYRDENRIAFTTFHQSYGYEEFIEGIKPVVMGGNNEVGFNIEPGIFKEFCDLAATDHRFGGHDISIDSEARIWKISLGGAGNHPLKKKCFEEGVIRIGWDEYGKDPFLNSSTMNSYVRGTLTYFYETMQVGDIVLSLKDEYHIDGIGIVEGDVDWLESTNKEKYKRSRNVRWLAHDISQNVYEMNMRKKLTQKAVYPLDRLSVSQVERMLKGDLGIRDVVNHSEKPYVFIVDEINRGNISKILGELITLIEPSKRIGEVEETLVKLPYSKKEFGVPSNIYIIGTMNTADRSIALMDSALRRRFRFVEMSPDPLTLRGISIEGVEVERLLDIMNRRIEALYDRDHMIGHAYFTQLSSDDDVGALKELFLTSIIPLLQEYFFDDHEKIRAVLGDDQRKDGAYILTERSDMNRLFGSSIDKADLEKTYLINHEALSKPEIYKAIYEGHHAKV